MIPIKYIVKKQTFALLFLVFAITLTGCSSDDDTQTNCDSKSVINAQEYGNATSAQFRINSLEIVDDCLKINFSSGGCDGNTWKVKLIDSGAILKTDPPQRNLKLLLRNEELCEAYITKEFTFDISNLKVDGNMTQLNITNSDKTILYEY